MPNEALVLTGGAHVHECADNQCEGGQDVSLDDDGQRMVVPANRDSQGKERCDAEPPCHQRQAMK